MVKCEICGKELEFSGYHHANLCHNTECFNKHYWQDIVYKQDNKCIRICGVHYYIGNGQGVFKGYGGQYFKIKKFDGEIIETYDLWHNGTIPDEFKDKLPDNAEFIK